MPTLTHEEITRLSPEERLTLIGELCDSLDPAAVPVPPSQLAELRRRLDTFEKDRSGGMTWEQLRAQLARRAS
jgi:putative addiction module component (TIGR02574 family)